MIFIQALRQACLNLSNAPLKGKLRNEIGAEVRSIVYREHVIFHRLQNARRLVILRIFHGREDISTLSL